MKNVLFAVLLLFVFSCSEDNSKADQPAVETIKQQNYTKAIVLCLHDIGKPGKYSLSVEQFEALIELLNKEYEVYSLKGWYEAIEQNKKFYKQPVVLTFDDGYPSVFKHIVPLLDRYKMPATFFIYTDRYKNNSAFYKKLRSLPERYEVGSHTLSHADLKTLLEKKKDHAFFKELFTSKKKLEYLTQKEIISLAWPYGYHNKTLQALARKAGYKLQVSVDYYSAKPEHIESIIPRFTLEQPAPLLQFQEILTLYVHR